MSWDKKYYNYKPIKYVRCIDPGKTKFLRYNKVYGVIKETETTYRIKFKDGGTEKYTKDKFVEVIIAPPKPKPTPVKSNADPLF